MSNFLLFFLVIFFGFLFIFNFVQVVTLQNPISASTMYGYKSAVELQNPIKASTIWEVIDKIIDIIQVVVSVLIGVVFIIAGILYATSSGSPERMQTAKSFFIFALIGLIIVLLAEAIIATIKKFFLNKY